MYERQRKRTKACVAINSIMHAALFLLMLVDGVVVVVVCYYHRNTFIHSTKKCVRDKWHWLYVCEKSMWWWLGWKWTSHVTSPHLIAKRERVKLDTHSHTHIYIYMYIHTTTTKMTMTTINSLVNARVVSLYSNPLCACARHHQTDEKRKCATNPT